MGIDVRKAKGEYLGVHEIKEITGANFLEECLTWGSVNKAPNPYALNRFCANHPLKAFSGYLSGPAAKQVEENQVQLPRNVSPATVNRELALLKHICAKTVEWGYVKTNAVNLIKFLKEPPGHLRYLTREEMEALISTCPPHLKPIVVMAMHTGMRKSEILGLKSQDIDLAKKTITVRQTKNNEPKGILINRTSHEALQHLPRRLHSAYVFCNAAGEPYDEVKRSFNPACREAGIENFRFHDLRHTFASHLVMNDINLKSVQHLLGQKDIRITLP